MPSETSAGCTLSFCIPTYNRAATVCALVQRVLQHEAPDMEVVVLDNGSTDDTLERLAAITDSRLSVYSNGGNRGVLFNTLNVMLKGHGRYSALVLDKDSVDPGLIGPFKQFLLREQPACGYSEYHRSATRSPEVAAAGVSALLRVGYTGHHPTGYFFRADLLHELDIAKRFSDYDQVGHFPFDFVLAECSLRGPGAVYHPPLFTPEPLSSAAKTKSFGTNASREDAFFSPKGRLKMAINFSSHIQSLPIPAYVKRRLILDRLAQGLFAATLGYRNLLNNESICLHYHIATRRISVPEMMRTGLDFYRSFFRAYPGGRVGSDVQLSHARVAGDWMRRVVKGLTRRAARLFA